METFEGHILTEAVQVVDTVETADDYVAGDFVLAISEIGPLVGGSQVRINGTVYPYDESLLVTDEAVDFSTVTLSTPLVADAPTGTILESWNPNAKGGAGDVNAEWKVQVAPDAEPESSGHTATLDDSMIPTTPDEKPVQIGESVTVQVQDDSSWLVLRQVGATPEIDPGYFRTGTIQADVQITVGDPDGKRVVIDGSPAIEAYDATNTQTVNIDGEDNYMTGTLSTAPDGQRIEIGAGPAGGLPTNEVRFISGLPDETDAAKLRVYTQPLGGGDVGTVEMTAAALSTDGAAPPVVRLTTGLSGVATNSAQVEAYDINLVATNDILLQPDDAVVVVGVMDATMRDGSVGSGTFRDSVDARIAALLAGMGHIERAESAQSIATGGSPTVVTWATSTVAGRGGISYSGGVFTLAEAGTYLTKVYTSFPNAGGARRQCQIRKNGVVGVSTNQSPPTTGVWSAETTEVLDYAAGDTIDVRVFQDSGGALTITGTITIHRLA